MKHPRFWIGPALLLVCLLLGTWLRWTYPRDWLVENSGDGQPAYSAYMVGADSYGRLIRVQNILDGQGLVQTFHAHENYPEGITPSTTLPFDLVILGLYPIMQAWSMEPLDWAGAFAAYACFLVMLGILFFWSGRMAWRWEARAMLLFGVAATPGIMWATPFARPDHQALIILLLAIGLAAELIRWDPDRKEAAVWSALAGASWALALWTSLFEPLILFPIILATNLIARRREQHPFLIAFTVVAVLAVLIEGAHLRDIVQQAFSTVGDDNTRMALGRWSETISELKPMWNFNQITVNLTAMVWLLPVIVVCLYRKKGLRIEHHLLVGLALLLTLFSLIQIRWFYFGTLGLIFISALFLEREKINYLRYGFLAIVAGSLVFSWYEMFSRRTEQKTDAPIFSQVKKLAELAREENSGSVLAPYWLAPAFTYYSGRPTVASSSHLTIGGILDTSRFFSTNSWKLADEIIAKRDAGWVLAFDAPYTQKVSETITGQVLDPRKVRNLSDFPVSFRLYLPRAARAVPSKYKLMGVQPQMRLYRIQTTPGQPIVTP